MTSYMTAAEAAAYLRTSYDAFDVWVRRHGVPHQRRGRVRLFTREALDLTVQTMAQRPAYRWRRSLRKVG